MGVSITYDSGRVEAYLDGFLNTIKEIIVEDTSSGAISKSESQPTQSKRDELLPVYMWCKNLWDKWLIANDENSGTTKSYENPYTVGKFFKNFIFIDCLYRNVFDCLPISCQKFMDLVDGLNAKTTKDDTSLFSFIGNLADRSKCLFIALPDFIDFGTVTEQGEMKDTGLNNMKKIFQPVPMSKMRPMALNNIFVTIYIHEPSKVAVKNNGKLSDYFDICDEYGVISEDAETLFQTVVKESESERKEDNNMTYGAFPVPSFAVGFGGQHNHLFTDVDVNMDNPVSTEHSIRIMSDIAQLGSGNGQSIAYQGQDVYPIFSNYAYECQVTMLGNAQIQPLMYFQLMNIPMWKGSYMIFNVRHSITPGNMVTTFKGMRMSKKCIPFLKKWAYPVPNRIPKQVDSGISMGEGMTGGNYGNGSVYLGNITDTLGAVDILGARSSDSAELARKYQEWAAQYGVPSKTKVAWDNYCAHININNREGKPILDRENGSVPEINKYLIPIVQSAVQHINQVSTFLLKNCDMLRRTQQKSSRHPYGVAIDWNKDNNGFLKWNGKGYNKNEHHPQYSILSKEDMDEIWNSTRTKSSYGSYYSTLIQKIKDGTFRKNSPNFIVVDIMAAHGFAWGGRYTDLMHFSIFQGS